MTDGNLFIGQVFVWIEAIILFISVILLWLCFIFFCLSRFAWLYFFAHYLLREAHEFHLDIKIYKWNIIMRQLCGLLDERAPLPAILHRQAVERAPLPAILHRQAVERVPLTGNAMWLWALGTFSTQPLP